MVIDHVYNVHVLIYGSAVRLLIQCFLTWGLWMGCLDGCSNCSRMRVLSRADGRDFVGIISISAILGRTVFVVNIECHIVPIEDEAFSV